MGNHLKKERIDKHSAEEFGLPAESFPVCIPPGEYEAICYRIESGKSWGGRTDYYVKFRIYGGESDQTELSMVCRRPKGKLTFRTKLYQLWMLVQRRAPYRGEPIHPRVFVGKLYRVRVRDTRRRHSGSNSLQPDYFQYSVVDTILEVLTGVPSVESRG